MSRQPNSDLHRGLASLINDGDPSDGTGADYNPLAGARPARRGRRWLRRVLLWLLYLAIVGVIVWQGSRFWQEHPILSGLMPGFLTPEESTQEESSPARRVNVAPPEDSASDPSAATAESSRAPVDPVKPVETAEPAEPDAPVEAAPTATPAAPEAPSTATPVSPVSVPPVNSSGSDSVARTSDPSTANDHTEPVSESAETVDAAPAEPPSTDDERASPDTANPEPEIRRVMFSQSGRNERMKEARIWFREGQQERALSHLATWLRNDDHTDVRQLYGRLLLRADQPQQARRVLQPQTNAAEMELRAYADYQTGAYADAVRYYTRLLNEAPTIQTEWYLWLGISSEQRQRLDNARRYYRLFLREGQQQPANLRDYAQTRLQQLD